MIAFEEMSAEEELSERETSSLNHSYICSEIMRQLLPIEEIEFLTALTLAIGNGITPDISIYPKSVVNPDFWSDVTRFEQPPMIAIEVISPSQNIQTLLEKAKILTESGTKRFGLLSRLAIRSG